MAREHSYLELNTKVPTISAPTNPHDLKHGKHRLFRRYYSRLRRLKSEADSSLSRLGDEFEDMLSLDELGFVEPSSVDISSLRRTADGPHAPVTGKNVDDVYEMGNRKDIPDSGGGSEVATEEEVVGDSSDGARSANAGGHVDTGVTEVLDIPRPRPMNIEGNMWDREGDHVPLPAWNVSY